MNHYETVFILTPVLSDAQMKEAVDKFKAVITDNAGAIVNEENWGLRKLAYPIQKKSTGFYSLIEFSCCGFLYKANRFCRIVLCCAIHQFSGFAVFLSMFHVHYLHWLLT